MVIRLTRMMTAIALVIGMIAPVATASAADRGTSTMHNRRRRAVILGIRTNRVPSLIPASLPADWSAASAMPQCNIDCRI